ncbi:MAG: hypothetical protein ACK5D8_03390 [Bacteroidota bacterium]
MDLMKEIIGDSWKENIVLASIPLWKYDNEIPIANASGCLIKYKGKLFIISIAHSSIAESTWNVGANDVEEKNGELGTTYQPVDMQSLSQFQLVTETNNFTEPKIVDFTYRKLPEDFKSTHCIGIINQNEIIQSDRTVFETDLDFEPSISDKYGFYGKVKFKGVTGRHMNFEHRLESNLKYLRTEDEFLVFELPHKYGSHSKYIGCSGAPIIDTNNNVVALVSFGLRSTNCIYGIDIRKYKAVLEIETLD